MNESGRVPRCGGGSPALPGIRSMASVITGSEWLLFMKHFQGQPAEPDCAQRVDDRPLDSSRFIAEQIHVALTQVPHADVGSNSTGEYASVRPEVTAWVVEGRSRLPRGNRVAQGGQVQDIGLVIIDILTAAAGV